jgi:predicted metal-dependent phosphoesterase TrpH
MMRIDLHTHSTASDGTDAPADLIRAAAADGLDVIAITDHDTTAGWDAALAARPRGLTVVPGVEFSCVFRPPDGRPISLHLLAYLADPDDPELRAEWARLQESRLTRGRVMVDNLVAAGFPISWEQVAGLAAGGSVGRPHIGRALVAAGVVPDVDTAFRELLSSRQPYYVRKADTDVFEALRLIAGARGVAVFAHPLARRRGPVVDDETIAAMAAAGLAGLEVDHRDHEPAEREHLRALAAELGLLTTGASDYHGTGKVNRLGENLTSPQTLERIEAEATGARVVRP